MRRLWNEIPRKLRFALDAVLALVLILAAYIALDCPTLRMEETRFRRAERANLVGPAMLLDRLDVPPEWISVGYDRLLMGDAGEEILFFAYRRGRNGQRYTQGTLWRREKTEGLLLTPVPRTVSSWQSWNRSPEEEQVVPLILFADDPRAVRAELELRLSDTYAVTLTRERRGENGGYFRFDLPLSSENRGEDRDILDDLSTANMSLWQTRSEYPATVRLYDESRTLLETRDCVIRSRAADAEARNGEERS